MDVKSRERGNGQQPKAMSCTNTRCTLLQKKVEAAASNDGDYLNKLQQSFSIDLLCHESDPCHRYCQSPSIITSLVLMRNSPQGRHR